MPGYFRRPKETAQVIRDGWFLTGDIGKADADGYFYLVDRAKDMINVSGFKCGRARSREFCSSTRA